MTSRGNADSLENSRPLKETMGSSEVGWERRCRGIRVGCSGYRVEGAGWLAVKFAVFTKLR